MRYLALLRGINVGGKSLIKMNDLKASVLKAGFENVVTSFQSGNVIFESSEDAMSTAGKLETVFQKRFGEFIPVVVLSGLDLNLIMQNVPDEWKHPIDLRMYVAFVHPPTTADDLIKTAQPRAGIDSIKAGKGAVYMTTKLSQKTHSGFLKLLGLPIYKDLSIRSYSTLQKIHELIKK